MSTVWDRTTEFLSDNLAALTPIVLLGTFVPLALIGTLMPLMGSTGAASDWALGIVVVFLSLVTIWAGIAITALAFDPPGGLAPALSTANRRVLPVLGISLVTLLAVIVSTLPITFVLSVSGIDMTALAAGTLAPGGVNGGALAFAMLYGLVLFFVLFWAYARLIVLITPILVMERRGLGVYRRNFILTRGITWKVIGVLLLYGIVSWVASAAARMVFGTVFALLIGGNGTLSLVLTRIIVAAVTTVFSVLSVAFVAKLYLATRDAREAIVEAA